MLRTKVSRFSDFMNIGYTNIEDIDIYNITNAIPENAVEEMTINSIEIASYNINIITTGSIDIDIPENPYPTTITVSYSSTGHSNHFLKATVDYHNGNPPVTFTDMVLDNISSPTDDVIPIGTERLIVIPGKMSGICTISFEGINNSPPTNKSLTITVYSVPYGTIFSDDNGYFFYYLSSKEIDIEDSLVAVELENRKVIDPAKYYSTILDNNRVLLKFTYDFYKTYKDRLLKLRYNAKTINDITTYNYEEYIAFYPIWKVGFPQYMNHKNLIKQDISIPKYIKFPDIKLFVRGNKLYDKHFVCVTRGYNSTLQIDTTRCFDDNVLRIYRNHTLYYDYGYKKINREKPRIKYNVLETDFPIFSKRNQIWDFYNIDVVKPDGYDLVKELSLGINIYSNGTLVPNEEILNRINYNYVELKYQLLYSYSEVTYITTNEYTELNTNINPLYDGTLHGKTYLAYIEDDTITLTEDTDTILSGILGAVYILSHDEIDISVTDVRKRGGGIRDDTDINPDDYPNYTDIGSWDNLAHQRNYVVVSGISGIISYDDFIDRYYGGTQ